MVYIVSADNLVFDLDRWVPPAVVRAECFAGVDTAGYLDRLSAEWYARWLQLPPGWRVLSETELFALACAR